jgi:hypothetical protein
MTPVTYELIYPALLKGISLFVQKDKISERFENAFLTFLLESAD